MNRIRFLFLAIVALFAVPAAMAQTVTVTGSHVLGASGQPLASGSICFSANCFSVSNGLIAGGAFAPVGAQTVVIRDGSGTAYWSLSNVSVPSPGPYNFDTIVVGTTQTLTIAGIPYAACSIGAMAIQTSTSPNTTWTCAGIGGRIQWTNAGQGASTARASGLYAGAGAPSFYCISPCSYTQSDGSLLGAYPYQVSNSGKQWVLNAPPGAAANTWVASTAAIQLALSLENSSGGLDFGTANPTSIRRLTMHGHIIHTSVHQPYTSGGTCGGWAVQPYSSDLNFSIAGSAGITSCTIYFATPHGRRAFCTANGIAPSGGPVYVTSSNYYFVTFAFGSGQTGLMAHCEDGK